MKNKLSISILAVMFIATCFGTPAFAADEATSTPAMGGHRHAIVAGSVDSIHHQGPWILENKGGALGQISYVVENPTTSEESRVRDTWLEVIGNWVSKF